MRWLGLILMSVFLLSFVFAEDTSTAEVNFKILTKEEVADSWGSPEEAINYTFWIFAIAVFILVVALISRSKKKKKLVKVKPIVKKKASRKKTVKKTSRKKK